MAGGFSPITIAANDGRFTTSRPRRGSSRLARGTGISPRWRVGFLYNHVWRTESETACHPSRHRRFRLGQQRSDMRDPEGAPVDRMITNRLSHATRLAWFPDPVPRRPARGNLFGARDSGWISRIIPMVEQKVIDQSVERKRPAPANTARTVWPTNPIVALWATMVGKKVVMAVTGVILVGFVVAHMVGNLKIFLGREGHQRLRGLPPRGGRAAAPLWSAPLGCPHHFARRVLCSTSLPRLSSRCMNWAARPRGYETKRSIATSYAALTMRYSGVIVAVFIVYHILHLTVGVVGFQAGQYRAPFGLQ